VDSRDLRIVCKKLKKNAQANERYPTNSIRMILIIDIHLEHLAISAMNRKAFQLQLLKITKS
jgi:hypothetical protein